MSWGLKDYSQKRETWTQKKPKHTRMHLARLSRRIHHLANASFMGASLPQLIRKYLVLVFAQINPEPGRVFPWITRNVGAKIIEIDPFKISDFVWVRVNVNISIGVSQKQIDHFMFRHRVTDFCPILDGVTVFRKNASDAELFI